MAPANSQQASGGADSYHWQHFAFSLVLGAPEFEQEVEVWFERDSCDYRMFTNTTPELAASFWLNGYGGKVQCYIIPRFIARCRESVASVYFGRPGKFTLKTINYWLADDGQEALAEATQAGGGQHA